MRVRASRQFDLTNFSNHFHCGYRRSELTKIPLLVSPWAIKANMYLSFQLFVPAWTSASTAESSPCCITSCAAIFGEDDFKVGKISVVGECGDKKEVMIELSLTS